jgi:glutamate [NMDA] receptor subunit 3A, putative
LEGKSYIVQCCSGIAIDLLNSISRDLNFVYDLYLVSDGLFGIPRSGGQWDGITADLVSGAAHLTFSAYSITSDRVNVINFNFYY